MMDRYGNHPSVWVLHSHVAALLTDNLEARFFESTYELRGFQHGQPGHQTATF